MARKPTQITVYWDTQDRENEGWAYRLSDANGDIESGAIDNDNCDLDTAIEEAIAIGGVAITPDQFAKEPNVDGGFAIWTAQ